MAINYLDGLKAKRDLLNIDIQKLRTKLEVIEELIAENTSFKSDDFNEIPIKSNVSKSKKQTLREQFLEVLVSIDRFSKSREISEKIAAKYGGDADEIVQKISRYTSKWVGLGLIVKHQIGSDPHKVYWGLKSWVREVPPNENEPKDKHLPIE